MLENISFSVGKGQCIGILGANRWDESTYLKYYLEQDGTIIMTTHEENQISL